jgi:sugar lactone lactonase YvrE
VTSDPSQQSSVTVTIVNPLISVAMSTIPASLAVGGTTNVSAVVTNDVNTLGATWTASCGSSDCGSFSAKQTLSGVPTTYTAPTEVPQGGTVTLTATSVGDSTKSASATITILPITVAVSPSTFNIATSGTQTLTAGVTNDVKNAGVTWSCGASGCGTFSSTKTASGATTTYTAPSTVPSGGAVRITATSANDGSTSATAVATVTSSPVINVTMIRTVPASLAEGKTATLSATVTGDSTNAGVDWTAACGSSTPGACGTFNPATTNSGSTTTYTAPSSLPPVNPVVITATSHAHNLNPALAANAATADTTITAPESIAFTEQPPASVTANSQVAMSATVTNDTTPGGITWTVQCSNTAAGACGYVRPYQAADGATATYVAPPVALGVPVQIIATSTAFPAVSAQSTPITVVPSTVHSIALVPFAPSQLPLGDTVTLNAAVANDPSQSGVDWAVCGSGCGFFTIKPAIPAIPAVPPSPGDPGSPYVPDVPAVIATSVQGWPNGLPIPYTAPTVAPNDGSIVITATATADRLNNVSSPATAVSTITLTSEPTGPELHGIVQAGSEPIVGASVYLYAAGTSGYASASTPIYNPSTTPFATSDSSGNFKMPAGYTCPALTSQIYLVALGGQVGTSSANPNLGLMTALGPCGNLSSTPVVINEITTVASVTALALFSADNAQTGELSYLYIGSSSANSTVGLADAFASVNNLVEITTGQPKFFTIAGNAAVPYVEINTLADALNACAVTAGGSAGDGTVCGDLFTDTNPLGARLPASAPTDTLQAVFDLVKPPSSNVAPGPATASVLGLASLSSPYQPILSSAPDQWSISLNYTSGGGVGGSGSTASGSSALAIDASGNVWIANKSINSVSEWNSFGASYSPNTSGIASGLTSGGIYAPTAIAVDPSGYVWVVNGNGTLTKLDTTGTADTNSPFSGGGLSTGAGIAIDGLGNIWVTNSGSPGSISKFNTRGIPQSPTTGYTDGIADPSVIATDASGNVWVYNQQLQTSVNNYVELNNANGSLTVGVSGSTAAYDGSPAQLAIDTTGNLWSVANSATEIIKIPAGYPPGAQVATYPTNPPTTSIISGPQGMAFDGSNRLWVANAGSSGNSPSNLSLVDTTRTSPDVVVSYSDTALANGPSTAAVDNAGNVWVLLGNNTVKEYVGIATPVVTPLSLSVKENKLGSKP